MLGRFIAFMSMYQRRRPTGPHQMAPDLIPSGPSSGDTSNGYLEPRSTHHYQELNEAALLANRLTDVWLNKYILCCTRCDSCSGWIVFVVACIFVLYYHIPLWRDGYLLNSHILVYLYNVFDCNPQNVYFVTRRYFHFCYGKVHKLSMCNTTPLYTNFQYVQYKPTKELYIYFSCLQCKSAMELYIYFSCLQCKSAMELYIYFSCLQCKSAMELYIYFSCLQCKTTMELYIIFLV